ncbi:MAG: butyrate kinase [candidate division Zixibacteria bacterium]|nr:butyrate kinase [Candidatus Tariuqbacter arcticus]
MNPQDKTGILVINPGATSTKVAIFDREEALLRDNYQHHSDEINKFPRVIDQFDYRRQILEERLSSILKGIRLLAVAGRGGPLKPLEGGTYLINQAMINDLNSIKYSDHASNHGALLAHYFAEKLSLKAYVVDPVTVDNFTDLARLSGLPEIERKCRSHALNIKATGRIAAEKLGKKLEDINLIVLHLGSGFSICPLQSGKIVDVNDALLGMGPYSVNRAGAMPIGALVKLCFSGRYTENEILKKLSGESGLQAYIGTSDMKQALTRIESGDEEAELAVEGMLYQVAKEAGACAAVLKGKVDGVVLTGGVAHSVYVVERLREYLSFLAPFMAIPGEFEMEALSRGVYRVLDGKEEAKIYRQDE